MKDKMRVTVQLNRELHRKAKVKAALTGITMSEVMREALRRWVGEDQPDKRPESP